MKIKLTSCGSLTGSEPSAYSRRVTHGDTYAEALEHGLEAVEALIASAHKHHETLPEPQTFAAA